MIRDRRDADLDRLAAVLGDLGHGAGPSRDWLHEVDAERSWVFDQAPVSVAPTRNVVGHVQIYRSPDTAWIGHVAEHVSRPVDDLLVIGRLFVKPGRHEYGIARYLFAESVKYVEQHGCLPVLDPLDIAFLPAALQAKLGFRDLPIEHGVRSALIRLGE